MTIINSKIKSGYSITAKSVMLIDEKGTPLGVIDRDEAIDLAESKGLSLVEVSSKGDEVVCKIMDLGKHKYMMQKKNQQIRKNQKVILIKTLKIRPAIGKGDLDIKIKQIGQFIDEGNKVKIIMMLRGRENIHVDLAKATMQKLRDTIIEQCAAVLDQDVKHEGRNVTMLLSAQVKK